MTGLADPDPYFRIAFCTRTTTVAADGTVTVAWKYDPNSATLTTFDPTSTMVVIGYMRVSTDEIDYMQMFREAVPIDIVQDAGGWVTTNFNADGTSATLNTGVTINGGGIVIDNGGSIRSYGKTSLADTTNGFFLGTSDSGTSYDFAIGDATKHIKWDGSASTMTISGKMVAGSVESSDGKTYFDLDNDKLVVNDGSHDRLVLGDISSGGTSDLYGIKVAHVGYNAIAATDNQLMFSSTFALPAENTIYSDSFQIAYDSSTDTIPTTFSSDAYWIKNYGSSYKVVIVVPFIKTMSMKKMYFEGYGRTSTTVGMGIRATAIDTNTFSYNPSTAATNTTDSDTGTLSATEKYTINIDLSSVSDGTQLVVIALVKDGKIMLPRFYWKGV
tara:strand:- start:17 stop:1174 length:1158 start_codon:yes stop_codon:yes gene_type:complete